MSAPLLALREVSARQGAQTVLHALDLQLHAGDFVALVGPNGAGKSTLLQVAAGVHPPASGTVRIAGIDVTRDRPAAVRGLGLAVDPAQLPGLLTGRECLALFARVRGFDDVPADALELARTLALDTVLDRRVAQYSLGMKQKLGVLLGLLGAPPVLLLDEPLNGLDPRSAYALKRHLHALCARGHAVLLATHALEVAERFVNRAVLLLDGRIARQWSREELDALRADPAASLEQAMADAMA